MSVVGRHGWGRVSSLSPLQVIRAGQESGVDVWATAGMPLAVGDRVLLLDMDGALIVLQPLVPADTYAPPAAAPETFTFNRAPIPAGVTPGDYWFQAPGDVGWATDLTAPALNSWMAEAVSPPGLSPQGAIYVKTAGVITSARVWCVPPGTGGLPVTAGRAYTVTSHFMNANYGEDPDQTVAVGVDWYDAAGNSLSQSQGSAVGCIEAEGDAIWIMGGGYGDYGSGTWVTAAPTVATLTAPAGAAFARPYLLALNTMKSNAYGTFRVSYFDFVAA